MSEQFKPNSEHSKTENEPLLEAGHVEKLLEASTERSPAELHTEAAQKQATVEKAQEAVRSNAETNEDDNPLARHEAVEAAKTAGVPAPPPNTFLRKQTLKRELATIQRKESTPDRALSKIIHNPLVSSVSEVTGKTISRPSGLLGGGIVAFLGTGGYLYLAKHIGFVYQPAVFLLLLAAGFALGLLLEMLLRAVTSRKA